MNNTQKALINQDVCEQTTPNLGITQSSGLDNNYLELYRYVKDSAMVWLVSFERADGRWIED